MGRGRREPADLAKVVEQGVQLGIDAVDGLRAAIGQPTAAGRVRALERQNRHIQAQHQRALKRFRHRLQRARQQRIVGTSLAGVAGTLGLLDLVIEGVSSASGVFGPAWLWCGTAGVAAVIAVKGSLTLRHAQAPQAPVLALAPPPPLPLGARGAAEVARLASVRLKLNDVASAVSRLHPDAATELRRADREAAGPLNTLAERLALLHQIAKDLPGSAAALASAESAQVVAGRLADGCQRYEELLAAAARLLAAPDQTRSTEEVLGPAVASMVAYAHGLQQASTLYE